MPDFFFEEDGNPFTQIHHEPGLSDKTACGLSVRGVRNKTTRALMVDCPNCRRVIRRKNMTDAPKEELTDEIIDGRRGVYGDPEETFQAKADMWTVLFRHQLKPGARITKEQVALAMILFKTVRANETPDYSDNPDDIVGYADIFRLVQGEDFIQARNVGDYLEKKSARDSAKEQSYLRDDQKLVADSLAQNRQRNL